MKVLKKIQTALISVYYKDRLDEIVRKLDALGVKIYSTGGTYDFIRSLQVPAETVESLTGYPGILGGRVKTLHPKVFGGILGRPELPSDLSDLNAYGIPTFDLVIVDLYPFTETLEKTTVYDEIIEKIDIGGISLIRAAAKNLDHVLVVPSSAYYDELIGLLNEKEAYSSLSDRQHFAAAAFSVSSAYDTAIFNWMNQGKHAAFRQSIDESRALRYGENPHQQAFFYGKLDDIFEQLHGKELSYNNLLDLDAGLALMSEFEETTFAILKHNNACGIASRENLTDAYKAALAGDPVSAFGGVLVSNRIIDENTAAVMNDLFFEIVVAPDFEKNALDLLRSRKNRVILRQRAFSFPTKQFRSILNGALEQDRDRQTEQLDNFSPVTLTQAGDEALNDMVFANKIVKHTRSNAIVLAKNKQLLGSGIGQTSRVDALKQAIAKAHEFGFDLQGAVMASDAFFPFADSVEIAGKAGVKAVVQPGGSVRDQDSIDYCNQHGISMVFTGTRHFKH
ncbi:MAG: bifunctional phosphoribosylaminoimidazolecarboxamide formyltransferase/IMP cyclohydrolase [Bacteroidales bacterium]|nr:bifunctional phosphoribosylaminoimidazolecarboxamide formyltransferase/IMP cyclohydrolase [Bacteroidales bacterium]